MPYTSNFDCPSCSKPLVRKPAGRCPHCGATVGEHVSRARRKEKRIEQTVAVFATVAVATLYMWVGGVGFLEGIAVYAVAGVAVWYWGKGTFWSAGLSGSDSDIEDDDRPGGDSH